MTNKVTILLVGGTHHLTEKQVDRNKAMAGDYRIAKNLPLKAINLISDKGATIPYEVETYRPMGRITEKYIVFAEEGMLQCDQF